MSDILTVLESRGACTDNGRPNLGWIHKTVDDRLRDCADCPVRDLCARYGAETGSTGEVYGGVLLGTKRTWTDALDKCPNGHPYTTENTRIDYRGYRTCRKCRREQSSRYRDRKKGLDVPEPKKRTHCRRGHPFTEENTYVTPRGIRMCLTCRRETNLKHMRAKRGIPQDAPKRQDRTCCAKGHELTPENTNVTKSGRRKCRTCQHEYDLRYRAKKSHEKAAA